jgi:cell wall-associated NlpC family hydrolase
VLEVTSEKPRLAKAFDYFFSMNIAHNTAWLSHQNLGRTLAAFSLLFLAACQSPHHAKPPPTHSTPLPATPAVVPKIVTPAAWKTEAERWVGTKYRKGGVDRTGIDCSGLTSRMYLDVAGLSLPRTVENQSRCGKTVPRSELRPGDLIFFASLTERAVDHVGLYLGDDRFVHASPSKGVVISSLRQDYYVVRFRVAKRTIP